MYTLTYTKSAIKDIPKLKSAKLDTKAKALLEIIKVNPTKHRQGMKNWWAI